MEQGATHLATDLGRSPPFGKATCRQRDALVPLLGRGVGNQLISASFVGIERQARHLQQSFSAGFVRFERRRDFCEFLCR